MSDPVVLVDAVVKTFGDLRALDELSFAAHEGEILGVLGPNGAGKTTVVHILSTLLHPDAGQAHVDGYDTVAESEAVRRSIALTGQFAAVDGELTGLENLVLFGRLLGLERNAARDRAGELLASFSLTEAQGRPAKTYSGGMRRRLDIAISLMVPPRVLFLDEPTTGLDPRSRHDVWEVVERLRADGVTIVLTTQYLEEADRLADRIIVIDRGRVIAEGTPSQLKTRTGPDQLVLTPTDVDPQALAGALDGFETTVGTETVSLPIDDGPRTVATAMAALGAAGIELADVALRKPTLDDVFFNLTGHTTEADDD
ncbi:ATP-binding cassette domain-containing protein [Aeromicrobium sp. CTD01-1L150]|uniref:ATP-binding cassette domain-containing protein n=1 Tax=Aeromicrobium sp. CTD01-1L150 TaxID=3341830 RepID=UPI0035C11FE4